MAGSKCWRGCGRVLEAGRQRLAASASPVVWIDGNPQSEIPMRSAAPATTVLDSLLFRDAFGTPAMREVFSDYALVARYAEVEIALAKAEAKCGVIPVEAAEAIAERTDVSAFDFDLLRQETDNVGYPILPLVHQMA